MINEANKEISNLQNSQSLGFSGSNLIDPKYQITEQDLEERNHIAQNPKLKTYCETLQNNLNQAFLVSAVIGSGKVASNDGKISSVLKSLEGLSSGIPIGASIFSAVSRSFGELAKTRRAGRYSNFEDLITSGDVVKKAAFCERLARLITITNQHNINNISNLNKTSMINELNGFFRDQVSKVDDSIAKGLFEEKKSPEEILAHKNSKTAIEFVLSGELSQEIEKINNAPAKASRATTHFEIEEQEKNKIIDLLVEKTTGLKTARLSIQTAAKNSSAINLPTPPQAKIQTTIINPPPAPTSNIPQDLDFAEMKKMMQEFGSMKEKLQSLEKENQILRKEVSALKDSSSSNDSEVDVNISSGNQMFAQKKSLTQSSKSKERQKAYSETYSENENLQKRVAHIETTIPEISKRAEMNAEEIESMKKEQQRPSSTTKTKNVKPLQQSTQNKDCCVVS